jgi:hypothetical protein
MPCSESNELLIVVSDYEIILSIFTLLVDELRRHRESLAQACTSVDQKVKFLET